MSKYLRGTGLWHAFGREKTVIANVARPASSGWEKVREYPVVVKYKKRRYYVKPDTIRV